MKNDERHLAECDGGGDLLVAVLYGEATAAEAAEFERHAGGCASCRDELSAFRSVRERLSEWEQEPIPPIRVEIRPSLGERLRRAFGSMSAGMRAATAAGCAMLVLAALNTEVSVGRDGLSVRTSLLPRATQVAVATPAGGGVAAAPAATEAIAPVAPSANLVQASVTDEQVNRLVDEALRARLERQREELGEEIAKIERQLAASHSAELKQMAARLAAQRRQIETLQRDVDRQAGYGGDLFGELTGEREGS